MKLKTFLLGPRYEITFKVFCDKKTKRILKEVWYIRYKDFPIFPWRVYPSPEFESYEEASNWAEENLKGISISYNRHGEEEFC